MLNEENFLKLVESGSLKDLFQLIYTEGYGSRLLNAALMQLIKNQDTCKLVEAKVYELLRHGADADTCDKESKTLLHYSAAQGNSSLIDLLLHYGASVTKITTMGDSVLHSVARTSDPLSLSLLLVKVYEAAPELLEIRNQQKKKFYEIFRGRDQVLLFNRFQELKGMKIKARKEKDKDRLKNGNGLIALMVINDQQSVKQCQMRGIAKDSVVPLCLSTRIIRGSSHKRKGRMRFNRSTTMTSAQKMKIDCEYLNKYAHITFNLKKPLLSNDFSDISNLVDQLAEGNPFNIFNYACTMLKKESIVIMINTMQPRLRRGDLGHCSIDPIDSLKRFHPDLVDLLLSRLKDEEICAICKETDAILNQKWSTLVCRHKFHTYCIKEWFQFGWEKTCPVCRRVNYCEIK